MLSELELEGRTVFGSARKIQIRLSINLSEFSIPAFELIFPILEMELKDFVRTSVAFEPCRARASHSDEAMLTAQYKQGPVNELQEKLLFITDAFRSGREFAVRFNGDVFVAGCLETDVATVPIDSEEGRVNTIAGGRLDVAICDPVFPSVCEHADFSWFLRVKFHLENFCVSNVETLVCGHFIS